MGTLTIGIDRAAIVMAGLVRENIAFTAVDNCDGTLTIKMTGY